jgi:hypothetical protein
MVFWPIAVENREVLLTEDFQPEIEKIMEGLTPIPK